MTIICDNCGASYEHDIDARTVKAKRALEKEAEKDGWKTAKGLNTSENRHYCPECKDQIE